jgi:hypothetical protein
MDNVYPPLIITGAVTDIDKAGVVFHVKITELGKKNILEFGLVWDTIHNPMIGNAEKYIFTDKPCVGNFSTKMSTNLRSNTIYYVRAFIRAADVTTYGESMKFKSLGGKAPEIDSISTHIGNMGQIIKIKGKYFSSKNSVVKFNQVLATIISANQDSILVTVPSFKTRSAIISVSTPDASTYSKDSFKLYAAIIYDFTPKICTYGDEIIIKGKNFQKNPISLYVLFDTQQTPVRIIDDETLKVTVPTDLLNSSYNIEVVMNDVPIISTNKFSLTPVQFIDFNPKTALTGSTITITGANFNPVLAYNKVFIGGVPAQIVSVTKNTLQVKMPLQNDVIYNNRNATIQLEVGGTTQTATTKLEINDRWFRLNDAPSSLGSVSDGSSWGGWQPYLNYNYAKSYVVNNKVYVGLNFTKEFWSFDVSNESWTKLAQFPGLGRKYGAGFVYNNKIYFGLGHADGNESIPTYYNDWWVYDISSNKWTRKSDFPETINRIYRSFSTPDGCFISNGFTKGKASDYFFNFTQYSVENDSWTNSLINMGQKILDISTWGWDVMVGPNNEVIAGVSTGFFLSDMFKFNLITKSYQSMASWKYGSTPGDWSSKFCINNNLYIKSSNQSKLYIYNSISNSWIEDNNTGNVDFQKGISFSVNNKGYAGLGGSGMMYEYDPNR